MFVPVARSRWNIVAGVALALACGCVPAAAAEPAADLQPVQFQEAPQHAPVVLIENGRPRFSLAVMGAPTPELRNAIAACESFVKLSTDAELVVKYGEIQYPAIVLGDCDDARAAGLDGAQLPPDGFAIRSCADGAFIVGNDQLLGDGAQSNGTAWGLCEFCERFLDARWYFPGELGQSIPRHVDLSLDPVALSDAPAFRKREIWPPWSRPSTGNGTPLMPVQMFLRAGNSWPQQIVVHSPNWAAVPEYVAERPEVFQMRADGTRDTFMLCYGHPRTLETYLENVDRHLRGEQPVHLGIRNGAVTVSPNDAEISCHCEHCRALWNEDGGQYGTASRIVATFVAQLAAALQERPGDLSVIYLPYLNYTAAPEDVALPNNVHVQLCGMPGLAMYKEPDVAAHEQATIDRWFALTGRPLQNWHYSCWPANRTVAAYQYPFAVQAFYQANREKTVGTFINGDHDHWPRQHVSLHCWMKLLWDPDFNVQAMLDAYCRRMYGPAADPMRKLLQMQIERWELSRFPGGRLSPKGVYETAFPPDAVAVLSDLLAQARALAATDVQAAARLEYTSAPLLEFFEEAHNYTEGASRRPLLAQIVGEHPLVDGRLDDPQWERAEPVSFVRGWDRAQREPTYPTTVQAVWSRAGVTFGFRMSEPTPDRLQREIQSRDDSLAWWDDNVELLLDVTGANEGEFYHFIINAQGAVYDAKGADLSWNVPQMQSATFVGDDFWSLEVHFPFSAFPESKVPGTGQGAVWSGNFTRHRVAEHGLKPKLTPAEGSIREYQRMNTTYAVPSTNLQDFAPLRFVE